MSRRMRTPAQPLSSEAQSTNIQSEADVQKIQATCQTENQREESWRLGQLANPGSCSGGEAVHQSHVKNGLRTGMLDVRGT